MKRIITINCSLLVLYFACSIFSYAQDFQGYVILNSGDTLHGQIQPTLDDLEMYQKVWFYQGKERTVFEPEDLKGYQFMTHRFVTIDVGKKIPKLVFFRVLVEGHCSYYESMVIDDWVVLPAVDENGNFYGGGQGGRSTDFYLQRQGEEMHRLIFQLLKLGRDLYFLDNPNLTYDLQSGKYKKRDMVEVVRRYNKEWNEKNKDE